MFRKYATLDVLDAQLATPYGLSMARTAHRVEFEYTPRPGYLYVRSRMISSRCNDNFDEFPADQIKLGWKTFLGKPVFVNHHNADHRKARGVIIDAALHEDRNPDGSPDTWVEGLQEIDGKSYPKLARALLEGHIERTSMGVDVDYSICSKCGNKSESPLNYCQHIPTMKGMKAAVKTASGQVRNEIIREKCYGLRFFENSLLVEDPADPTAFFLGKVEAGPGFENFRRTAKVEQFNLDKESALSSMKIGIGCTSCYSRETLTFEGSTECIDCGHIGITGMAVTAAPRVTRSEDHKFFQANPVHHSNVVDHWNEATPDEKNSGKRWYADAGLVAHALGGLYKGKEHPHGNTHLAAGIIANYSPQTPWSTNQHNAARVLHEGQGRGGKGEGIMATGRQKEAANRMIAGEHHGDVLTGNAHKVHAFAHLVEHGGDKDPNDPRVCVDRHALSVATGKRMSDADYQAFPKANKQHYEHVASAYHEASRHISEAEGEHVPPHAVQATTWLVRQRKNQEGEQASAGQNEGVDRLNKGREKGRASGDAKWDEFKQQHLPDLSANPGTGYKRESSVQSGGTGSRHPFGELSRTAYGETKAPPDVDTLRDEECPICGEQDAYDGTECKVCGYVEPPKQFQDPNVDLARQLDLRKDVADPAQMDGQDIGHLQDAVSDPNRDGLDDETGTPIDPNAPAGPTLSCPACATEFPAEAPTSVETAPELDEQVDPTDSPESPEALEDPGTDPTAEPMAEGDVCPVCGKGVLVGTEEAQALSEQGPPAQEGGDTFAPVGAETPDPGEDVDDDSDDDDFPPSSEEEDDSDDSDSDEDSNPLDDSDDEDDDKPVMKSKNPFK